MAKFCTNCGREVEANEKFCLECGGRSCERMANTKNPLKALLYDTRGAWV